MVAIKQKFPRLPDGSIDIDAWLQHIKTTHHLDNTDLIKKTALLADKTSKGLTTFYGQPYIEQGLEMAEIILSLKLDQEAVAASVITNTLQHTQITIDIIKENLGDSIAKIAAGVLQMNIINTLLPNINKTRNQTQIDRLRKTYLAMVSDIRVVLIKLAEQICIMRGIKNINPAERSRLGQITLDIYAPLANRLGIGQLKWELEDHAFHYVDPEKYKTIAKLLAERRQDREKRIHEVMYSLKEHLDKAHIKSDISGRAKHIYSIYLKMQTKHLDYKDVYDASAIRILVPTQDDCYNALSIVHKLWEHIPQEFDDYIAYPKPNAYRSIHTAVVGSDGKNLEIQIRTHEMHDEAEHGIAAHWVYKENKLPTSGYEAKIGFLRQLLTWHKELAKKEAKEDKAIENFFEDRVYVFTPAGEIIDMPIGATPLDFAYHIHSALGHRCRGAKINGHIVPLTYQLCTGDRVDIITTANGTPSRDWLNKESGYLKTARARSKVLQWFRQQDVDLYIETGKHTLEKEFTKAGLHHVDLQKIAEQLNFKNQESLLSALGHGNVRAAQIVHAAETGSAAEIKTHEPMAPFKTANLPKKSSAGFQISGIDDLLTRIARCCKPIPGDAIIGYITQGRGVSIHRRDCKTMSELKLEKDDRIIQVDWDNKNKSEYYVDIQIKGQGNHDLLREITSILSNAKINLIAMNSTVNRKTNVLFIAITVQIQDREQVKQLIHQIGLLPNVTDVKRTTE